MKDLTKYGVIVGRGKVHEEVTYSLALIYNILNKKITSFLDEYDLTPGKLNILIAIRHHGGKKGLTQVEISKHLIVTKSNMTKLLDKLEKDGLVVRSALSGDRRVNITKITKKAEKIVDGLWDDYNKILKGMTDKISHSKQEKLATLLIEWFGELVE